MITNYLLTAIRNFIRNKFTTVLNIAGLAIGIATALLSFMYVVSELSYDRFHDKADRTYRLAVDALSGNTVIKQTYTSARYPEALYNYFPEIESICRIATSGSATQVRVADQLYKEDGILIVDTTFFDIFSAEFVWGEPRQAILAPNMAVLTRETARKYFGNENPVGKQILLDDEINLQISAVVESFPGNSHFHFDMLVSILSYDGFYNNPNWFANNFRSYILLQDNSSYSFINANLLEFANQSIFGGNYFQFANAENKWELYLQPLTDIHLHSHLSGEFEPNGNASYIYIFGLVAIFILLIACINYINLSTAKSSLRAREIGIRKCLGSDRITIIKQFLGESILTSGFAMVFALILVEIGRSKIEALLGVTIIIPDRMDAYIIPGLIAVSLIIGLLSGFYPALVLSSFQPLMVLRSQLLKGSTKSWARNTLVIFQFTISIVLITCTFIISRQLSYIQDEQLGFAKEQVLVIKNVNTINDNLDGFVNGLRQISGVSALSVSNRIIGQQFNNIGFTAEEFDEGFTLNLTLVDPDYADVMKLNMAAGRFFDRNFRSDTAGVILNQAAVKLIGWDDPVGKHINNYSEDTDPFTVLGVVEDLHYESRHTAIRPMAFFHMDSRWGWTPRNISVRFNTADIGSLVASIESLWSGINDQIPFEYSFFDDEYNRLYQNEQQTRKLFILFSAIVIFVACLGLFGLATFLAERRTHEIGIRKVLGASIPEVAALLYRQFSKWVLLANLFAWPVGWYVMHKWLENFAYRIDIPFSVFLLAGIIALVIALLTVSYQALKAAVANPVDSLRYE
ncbi:MAG: ABC transporter permease [Candidatus Neomarinimicrobiota bacterium]